MVLPMAVAVHRLGRIERVIGIEPTSSAWKADALAVVLYPHSLLMRYFTTTLGMVVTTFIGVVLHLRLVRPRYIPLTS